MKTYIYFSLLSSVLVSGSVYAACAPAPDCASLGYTASSCPNGGVKCPWDTNLWFCNKSCEDFGFNYDCTGSNEAGGVGAACGGKYTSCSCASGYAWYNGSCFKLTATSGYCCDDTGNYCGNYNYCKQNYGFVNCSQMIVSCTISGGMPRFLNCFYFDGYYYSVATFECDY